MGSFKNLYAFETVNNCCQIHISGFYGVWRETFGCENKMPIIRQNPSSSSKLNVSSYGRQGNSFLGSARFVALCKELKI